MQRFFGGFLLRPAPPGAKGGTPGEGPPFDPLLRFFGDGVFRALRRAARAPPLDPARFFVKKRGKKLLRFGYAAEGRVSSMVPRSSVRRRVMPSASKSSTTSSCGWP